MSAVYLAGLVDRAPDEELLTELEAAERTTREAHAEAARRLTAAEAERDHRAAERIAARRTGDDKATLTALRDEEAAEKLVKFRREDRDDAETAWRAAQAAVEPVVRRVQQAKARAAWEAASERQAAIARDIEEKKAALAAAIRAYMAHEPTVRAAADYVDGTGGGRPAPPPNVGKFLSPATTTARDRFVEIRLTI